MYVNGNLKVKIIIEPLVILYYTTVVFKIIVEPLNKQGFGDATKTLFNY